VTDIVADLASRGAIVVKGNHQAAIERETGGLGDLAQESADWTVMR
jgi:hypothetical protein